MRVVILVCACREYVGCAVIIAPGTRIRRSRRSGGPALVRPRPMSLEGRARGCSRMTQVALLDTLLSPGQGQCAFTCHARMVANHMALEALACNSLPRRRAGTGEKQRMVGSSWLLASCSVSSADVLAFLAFAAWGCLRWVLRSCVSRDVRQASDLARVVLDRACGHCCGQLRPH